MSINAALYSFSASSISTTEFSLSNNSTSIASITTVCVPQLWIDVSNMAAGDEYEIYLKEKMVSGGTQRTITLAYLVGAQPEPFTFNAGHILGAGWDFTMKRLAGSDRTFSWTIRAVT